MTLLASGFWWTRYREAIAFILQIAGHGLVGGQHELLDDAMGDVAFRAGDAAHQAVLVELDHRLRQIEIDGAAPFPLGG